jgi:hypothetical protein
MPRKSKTQLTIEQRLARTDDREPEQRIVEDVVIRIPVPGNTKGAFTAQVLPNGLDVIKRMARKGHSKASIAASLGISLEKFKEAMRAQPEVQDALIVGAGGLEDELVNILLEHARSKTSKFAVVAAIYLTKTRCGFRENDGPEEARPNIVINLPDSMSREQWTRAITVEVPKGELPK